MALAATTANSALEPVAAEGATAMRLDIDATLAQFQVLLEPCKRSEAQRATQIRKQLKRLLGKWLAEGVLSLYHERPLRLCGKTARYLVDSRGGEQRLRSIPEAIEMLQQQCPKAAEQVKHAHQEFSPKSVG